MKISVWNPFNRIAGEKALLYGGLLMLLTALAAAGSHCHFDALLHLSPESRLPWWTCFAEQLVIWICTLLVFYLAGRIFSRSRIRFLDVAGTMALARAPMLAVALLAFIPVPDLAPDKLLSAGPAAQLPLVLFALVTLPFLIWYIVLLYHAYAVSCNLKGSRAVWTFIVALILADILSRPALYFLLRYAAG